MNPDIKITSHNSPFPYVYLQNIFSETEMQLIYNELDFYQQSKSVFFQKNSNSTFGATNSEGVNLKNNGGFFMNSLWREIKSPIGRFTCSLFRDEVFNHNDNHFFKNFAPKMQALLVSYYESKDYYKPHRDLTVASLVIWLWKEPKKFSGGEFNFTDFPNLKLKTANNCAVLFPGQYEHHVNPVKMTNGFSDNNLDGYGRYSFTLFLDHEK